MKETKEPRFWWHWQNLNEDHKGNVKGSGFWSGRAWWHWVLRKGALALCLEWHFGREARHAHAYFQTSDGDHDILLGLALPWLFSLYLSFELPGRRHFLEREIGISWYEDRLSWRIWSNPHEWHSQTPRWRDGSFCPIDFVLGQQKYTQETLWQMVVEIGLPEKTYSAQAEGFRSTWKRPRWPWPKVLDRVTLDMEQNPIPIPGKGENSWDCDDDAIYSFTTSTTEVAHAVEGLRQIILETRKKRGWL